MRFAALYQRRGKLIIGAQGRTTAGVLIGIDEPVVIGAEFRTVRLASQRQKSFRLQPLASGMMSIKSRGNMLRWQN